MKALKFIALLLAVLLAPVSAESLSYFDKDNAAVFTLTDAPCTNRNVLDYLALKYRYQLRAMVLTHPKGVFEGCWMKVSPHTVFLITEDWMTWRLSLHRFKPSKP